MADRPIGRARERAEERRRNLEQERDLVLGLDPARLYSTLELTDRGFFSSADVAATYRARTRRTGELVGPKWIELGNRVVYSGAAVIEWARGPGSCRRGGRVTAPAPTAAAKGVRWCLLSLVDEAVAIERAAARLEPVAPGHPDLAEIRVGAAQVRVYSRRLHALLAGGGGATR